MYGCVCISGCHSFLFHVRECSVYVLCLDSATVHHFPWWSLSPGTSNCSWTSCREGCTKELYDCTQIRVNYKLPVNTTEGSDGEGGVVGSVEDDEESKRMPRYERSLGEYIEKLDGNFAVDDENGLPKPFPTGTQSDITLRTRDYVQSYLNYLNPFPHICFQKRAWLYNRKEKLVNYSCNWYFT